MKRPKTPNDYSARISIQKRRIAAARATEANIARKALHTPRDLQSARQRIGCLTAQLHKLERCRLELLAASL